MIHTERVEISVSAAADEADVMARELGTGVLGLRLLGMARIASALHMAQGLRDGAARETARQRKTEAVCGEITG